MNIMKTRTSVIQPGLVKVLMHYSIVPATCITSRLKNSTPFLEQCAPTSAASTHWWISSKDMTNSVIPKGVG